MFAWESERVNYHHVFGLLSYFSCPVLRSTVSEWVYVSYLAVFRSTFFEALHIVSPYSAKINLTLQVKRCWPISLGSDSVVIFHRVFAQRVKNISIACTPCSNRLAVRRRALLNRPRYRQRDRCAGERIAARRQRPHSGGTTTGSLQRERITV